MILKQFWTKVLCLKRKRNCPLCWLGIRFKAALSYSFPFENHELSMGLNMRSTLKQFSPRVLFKKFLSIPFPPLIWDQLLKLVSCSLPLDNEELSMELFWNHLWSNYFPKKKLLHSCTAVLHECSCFQPQRMITLTWKVLIHCKYVQ